MSGTGNRRGLSTDGSLQDGARHARGESVAADTDDSTTGSTSVGRQHRHRRHPAAAAAGRAAAAGADDRQLETTSGRVLRRLDICSSVNGLVVNEQLVFGDDVGSAVQRRRTPCYDTERSVLSRRLSTTFSLRSK